MIPKYHKHCSGQYSIQGEYEKLSENIFPSHLLSTLSNLIVMHYVFKYTKYIQYHFTNKDFWQYRRPLVGI